MKPELDKKKHRTLLAIYDRLAGLLEKLPAGIQKPVMEEIVPIREVFLESRPARLMVVGKSASSIAPLIRELAGRHEVRVSSGDNGWRRYECGKAGDLVVLDATDDVSDDVLDLALGRHSPDAVIFTSISEGEKSLRAAGVISRISADVPVFGFAVDGAGGLDRVVSDLARTAEMASRHSMVFARGQGEALAEALCKELPNPAKLELARLSGAKKAQAGLAGSLLKSFTAVCGIIGMQPIPLADMPVLTALQTTMVALVIHTTGRRADLRLVSEFLGALGINIGAGLLFREGARALVRVVPIWGNAVSGFVAGAGTYAIGRASIAYFIDELPIKEVRKIFMRFRPRRRETFLPPAPRQLPPPMPGHTEGRTRRN